MKLLNFYYNKQDTKISITSNSENSFDAIITVCDLELDCVYFDWETVINPGFDAWIIPLNDKLRNIILSSNEFSGFKIKVYSNKKRLLQVHKIEINNKRSKINSPTYFPDQDVVGHSYIDFFYGDLCNKIDFSGIVVDAGANVGFFTFLSKYKGSSRIYSIEPDPFPFYYLEKNFKDYKDVILINKAVSEKNKDIRFSLNLEACVGSSIEKYSNYNNKIILEKESITIQDILKIEDHINLLKLDIEGSEFEVIENLDTKDFNKINQFFIEFHSNPKRIEKILLENNYQVEYRHSDNNSQVGFIYAKKV